MELVKPSLETLDLYINALKRQIADGGETFHNSAEIIEEAERDPGGLIATFDDRIGGRIITVAEGVRAAALPSISRWSFDGDICGTIQFRWSPESVELPPYCLGHIGYQIFPWKRSQGYAKKQLALMLEEVAQIGMPYVELSTTLTNFHSQQVIKSNGGRFVKEFEREAQYGGGFFKLYRIYIA